MTSLLLQGPPKNTRWFIRRLNDVSPGNLRALWLPHPTDTTTNILKPDGRTWTNSASIAGRITYQGNGILVSFNGTDQYVSTPDTDNLSNGDGATDTAYSGFVVANITTPVSARNTLLSKTDGSSNQEWNFTAESSGTLRLRQWDQSAAANCRTDTGAVITAGLAVYGFTNTAATQGATAANSMAIYRNGVAQSVTPTNSASYVAMENLAANFFAFADANPGNYMAGSGGLAAVYSAALTASQHAQIASICRRYYKVAL